MKICVAIPTYNRKDKLIRTLGLLEKQTNKNFGVVISDNNSDYDIDEVLNSQPEEFRDRISVYRNKYNIGMSGNITSLFRKSNAEWCWFLADDDYPCNTAIESILNDIEKYSGKDISVIQYPHFDVSRSIATEYSIISDLKQFISYFHTLLNKGVSLTNVQGTIIYLSNKVYRIEGIKDYIRYAYDYCNTGIPQAIPIIKGLDEKAFSVLVHNKLIVEYNNTEEASWNVRAVSLGLSTLSYVPLDLTLDEKKRLWYLFMIRYKYVLCKYMDAGITDYDYLYAMYNNMYKFILEPKDLELYKKVIEFAKIGTDIDFLRQSNI